MIVEARDPDLRPLVMADSESHSSGGSENGDPGSIPVHGEAEIRGALERSRTAQREWASLSARDRARAMSRLGDVLGSQRDRIVARIVEETGKPVTEALAEIVVSADLIRHYVRVAPRALAPRRVGTGWMLWKSARVERAPFGVVAVITPWNYPLLLAMDAVTAALFAGNGVLLKPSELTTRTGLLIGDLCASAGLPEGLIQVVTGGRETGALLVQSGVDKVFFTGSSTTGRAVMRSAAERLTPVSLELGGKDPAIVLADADLERAARGIVFGAFFNAGQTCVSIERVLVERPAYDAFVSRVVELVGEFRQGGDGEFDLGPMTSGAQLDVVDRQVEDARARGARVVTGGRRTSDGRGYEPTVLLDVDSTMEVMTDESFGPILPIVPVADEEEAVRIANESAFGLQASVWTRDRKSAERIASRLRSGGVSINDSLSHYGVPGLPMGGTGASGFGSRRGVEGLLDMTRPRSILRDRLGLKREPWWFPYSPGTRRLSQALLDWRSTGDLHGLLRGARRMMRNKDE